MTIPLVVPVLFSIEIIILGAIFYIIAPVLIPIVMGFRCGLSMPRISTGESTLVGIGVAVAVTFLNLGWAKLTLPNGLWYLTFGAIPVFLVAGILAPRLICARINRTRGERHPPEDHRTSNRQRDLLIAGLSSVVLIGLSYCAV